MSRLKENWEVVEGYPNYLVSDLGNVKKKDSSGLKKLSVNNNGYCVTSLTNENGKIVRVVHRIVAEAFIGNVGTLKNVFHKDGNKMNNKVSNLEIVASSVITDKDVEFIRANAKKSGGSISSAELAREYGVSPVAIFKILNGSIRK